MRRTSGVSSSGEYALKIVTVINGTKLRGIITDWGGVLTPPILTTVRAWIQAEDIDWDSYRSVMRSWVFEAYRQEGLSNPIHALERGESTEAEFERLLAAGVLARHGAAVPAEGLLSRMFAASVPIPAMYDTIRAL